MSCDDRMWMSRSASRRKLPWSQNRFTPISDPSFEAFSLLGDLFGDDMRNVLVVKTSYWLNY